MTTTTPTKQTIRAMVRRHRELYRAMNRLYDLRGDDATNLPQHRAAMVESIDLENRIAASRATTRAEIAAKRRFLLRTSFINPYEPGLAMGDLHDLVEMILRLDTEACGQLTS